jgi:hypothetical protein
MRVNSLSKKKGWTHNYIKSKMVFLSINRIWKKTSEISLTMCKRKKPMRLDFLKWIVSHFKYLKEKINTPITSKKNISYLKWWLALRDSILITKIQRTENFNWVKLTLILFINKRKKREKMNWRGELRIYILFINKRKKREKMNWRGELRIYMRKFNNNL